jgi:hypothetical protein
VRRAVGAHLRDAAALGLRPTELDEERASNSNPPCIAQALERSETRTRATEGLRVLIDACKFNGFGGGI